MSSLFNSKKVASAVVASVPCSFAPKDSRGNPGLHKVVVLLDKDGAIQHLTCECLQKHGDGVQAILDLSGGDTTETLCVAQLEPFNKLINMLRRSRRSVTLPGVQFDQTMFHPLLKAAFNNIFTQANEKHAARAAWVRYFGLKLRPDTSCVKASMFQRLINQLVSKHVGIVPFVTENALGREVEYPALFTVKNKTDITVEGSPVMFTLLLRNHEVAEYSNNTWTQNEEEIRKLAAQHHHFLPRASAGEWTWKDNKPIKYDEDCLFCGTSFDRMSRHIQGAKHADNVIATVALACRATTRAGLKMLNNPRHRPVFLKTNV